ncbi:MAG TPA: LuxR C-terminal-related transcriptional regulator [Polyangiaceae bacterium]|nr:LuxR C-terminal-related transcriptional regulator [Polyangiaceae bacterium]
MARDSSCTAAPAGAQAPSRGAPRDLRAHVVELEGRKFVIMSHALDAKGRVLTRAEYAVLAGAVGGASNLQLARARNVSVRTIANQMARGCAKLGVRSRLELAARWSLVERE